MGSEMCIRDSLRDTMSAGHSMGSSVHHVFAVALAQGDTHAVGHPGVIPARERMSREDDWTHGIEDKHDQDEKVE